MEENKKITVFDLIRNVSYDKMYIEKEVVEETYSQILANKNFSLFYDTILYANAMNTCHNVTDKMNYDFYNNILPKRKRYAKWPKNNKEKNVILKKIQMYFDCGKQEAELYHRNMTNEDIDYINNYINL